jgi:hypothetical protein
MDNLAKELEDRQGKRIVATLGIVILFLVMGMAISTAITSAPAEDPKKGAYLQIEEVFFLLEGKGNDMVTIGVTAFITNSGSADAESVEIVAFVIEKHSNLALDRNEFTVGSIVKEKTKMAEFSLSMPDNDSYTIKLILIEDGKISIRGSGTVNLDFHSGGSGTRFATDSKTRGENGDEDGLVKLSFAEGSSNFPVWLLLGGLLAIILLVAAVRSTSSKKGPNAVLSEGLDFEYQKDQIECTSEDNDPSNDTQIIEGNSNEILEK